MNIRLFKEKFPKIAEKETRFVFFRKHPSIPDGDYVWFPAYCAEKDCDCRRVFFNVWRLDESKEDVLAASITYGWEQLSFYRNWPSWNIEEEMLLEMKGPSLNRMVEQSPAAPDLLDFFKEVLLKEESFAERIPRHYAYYKLKIGAKLSLEQKKAMKPLGPCPCESGKIFRMCCGKIRKTRKR